MLYHKDQYCLCFSKSSYGIDLYQINDVTQIENNYIIQFNHRLKSKQNVVNNTCKFTDKGLTDLYLFSLTDNQFQFWKKFNKIRDFTTKKT